MNYKTVFLLFVISFLSINFVRGQAELTEIQKLYASAKVWGFLKYYHPNVTQGKFEWDKQLFKILKEVEQSNTKQEISKVYLEWINSLGNFKECAKCKKLSKGKYFDKNFDLSWIDDNALFTPGLSKKLRYIVENRSLKQNVYLKTVGKAGNLEPEGEKVFEDFIWTENKYRLLALFRYWNFIEYFYPYKYLIDENWDEVLKEMIPRFLSPGSELEYHLAMLELVVKLDDSHAGLNTPILEDFFGPKFIPIIHRIVDGKAVVKGFFNDSLAKLNDLEIGDVIFEVDGNPIGDLITDRAKYFQGSNRIAKTAYAWNKIFNGSTDSVELGVLRNDVRSIKRIGRYRFDDFRYRRPQEKSWKMMEGNIGYVNMATFKVDYIPEMVDSLINSKALIFDVRNYPKDYVFLRHNLVCGPGKRTFYKSIVPDMSYPGKFIWKNGDTFKFDRKTKYKGIVIILVNERTISLAEFTAMYLQSAQKSVTIGSQTLAADGNVSSIGLLGGYKTGITGIGIFYPDGGQTQRTGIKIDVNIRPTIESFANGEDYVLKKTIEYINNRL